MDIVYKGYIITEGFTDRNILTASFVIKTVAGVELACKATLRASFRFVDGLVK
jgi:hypothetical protein